MKPHNEILYIISPLALRESLVDGLISVAALSGFTVIPVQGFSRAHDSFKHSEQVQGYRELIQFQILLNDDNKDAVMTTILPLCRSASLRFWTTPVVDEGHFV
ncbi:MAG: hypothetical protein CMF17_11385 [Idiomarinaceae bacterium]|nr:hypothetical protein [Idiomarinaceae bacterium]